MEETSIIEVYHPSICQDKRQDGEAWFRTLGLLKLGPGRRDDVLWRKAGMEIW